MTFPFIFNAHDQGQYRFFSGRNNTSVGRKNIHVKNSKQSDVIGRRQRGTEKNARAGKYRFRSNLKPIHHLSSYIKSVVTIAFLAVHLKFTAL